MYWKAQKQQKQKMNPFKPKLSTKNKLLNRFNVSMNTRHEQSFTNRVHSTANEQDENILRYRNHISFLQCRVDQQEATIEKLNCEIQTNFSNQSKLNAQILRLQRDNKKMLDNLYAAENRIRELEQQHNNKMLHCSIQRIQRQLNISRIRKRNKTLQDFENPEKARKPIKSMNLSMIRNMGIYQIPKKERHTKNPLRISSQIYTIQINNRSEKEVSRTKDSNRSSTQTRETQAQAQILLQKDKLKINKLQQAVYYLKKQLRDQQKNYKERILVAQSKVNEKKESLECRMLKNEYGWQILQLQTKVSEYAAQAEKKRQYMIETERKYGEQLEKMEGMMNSMESAYKELIEKKDKKLDELQLQLQKLKQSLRQNSGSQVSRLLNQSLSPRLLSSSSKEFGVREETRLEMKCIELQQNNDELKQQIERFKEEVAERQKRIQQLMQLMPLSQIKQKQVVQVRRQVEYHTNMILSEGSFLTKEEGNKKQQIIGMENKHKVELEKVQSMMGSMKQVSLELVQQKQQQNQDLPFPLTHQKNMLESKPEQCEVQQLRKLKLIVYDLQNQVKRQEQVIEVLSHKQAKVTEGKKKAEEQMLKNQGESLKRILFLEEQIAAKTQQIERILVLNRRLEGEVAEKQYFIHLMTQQMIAIKDKIQVQKSEIQSQTEGNNEEGRVLHTEQTVETQQENIEQLKYYYVLSIKEKDEEIEKWKAQYQENENEIQRLVRQIQQCQDKISEFKYQMEELNEKLSMQDNEIEEKDRQMENLRRDNHNLEQKLAFFNQYFSQSTNAEA